MSEQTPTREQFLSDVAKHELTIIADNGGSVRHLMLRDPKNYNRHFYITTWPGYLCISGDMGCFVWSRTEDMFTFFRDPELKINLAYWAEKVQAQEKTSGVAEYSEDLFRARIAEHMAEHSDDAELIEAVSDRILSEASNGEYAAHRATYHFEHKGRNILSEFYETNLRVFTFHYIWCCYAVVWAIQQYDAAKGTPAPMTRADEYDQSTKRG